MAGALLLRFLLAGLLALPLPAQTLPVAFPLSLTPPSPGGALVVPPGNYALSAPFVLQNTSGVVITCQPGTVLTNVMGGLVFMIGSSTDITITGCTIVSTGGIALGVYASKQVHILHNSIIGKVNLSGDSFVDLLQNTLNGGIFGQDNLTQLKINDNTVYGSIVLHTYMPGAEIYQTLINANLIYGNGPPEFCVEIGGFGSSSVPLHDQPHDFVVSNNNCVLQARMYGGYSFSQVHHYTATGNNFRCNGFCTGLAGLELVSADYGSVSSNTLDGSTLSIDGTSNSQISNNTISNGHIWAGSSRKSNLKNNVVTGNHSEGGLVVQCNYQGVTCGGNTFGDNYLSGNGTGIGILNENDAPLNSTMIENVFHHNHLQGFTTCFADSGKSTRFLDNFTTGGCTQSTGGFPNDPTGTVTTSWTPKP